MQHAIGRLFQSAQLFHSNNASVGVARRSLEVYNPGVHQLILDDSALSSTGTLPTNRPGIPGRWPILIVPELKSNVEVDLPKQLLLYFHGAGDSALHGMQILPNDYIQSQSMYMLCMASQGSTWDAIRTGFGHDLRNTDLALSHVLLTFPQISTIAVSGFSDGASYALGVGLTNVDLFSHILAWSPGFIARGAASFMQSSNPLPKVFIAHGANDSVLPIARCSKRIAIQLRGNGNIIHFEEFAGEHEVPREIAIQALKYWLQDM